MIPDFTIKDYYLQFIYKANKDIINLNNELKETNKTKENLYKYINDNKTIIKDIFNIDLDTIELEFIKKEYNDKEYLYNNCIKLLKTTEIDKDRTILLQIIKYCNILRNINTINDSLDFANKRKNIKFNTYRKYISTYFNKVHKCVLEGNGYKFSYGIGTYVINYWRLDPKRIKNKKRLDYDATRLKKQELLSKGIKLYDEKEALWYKARHIPYNGVDYRVFKNDLNWYEFTFINSELLKNYNLDYQRTEYVATKYRGMSYTDMADKLCKTTDDIYNLQVDIKYKLNILLYKNPSNYLNYIRNAEQCKYQYRKNNS